MDNIPKIDQIALNSLAQQKINNYVNDLLAPQCIQQQQAFESIQRQKREREQKEEKRHSELLEEAKQSNVLLEEQNSKLEKQNEQLLDLNDLLKQKLADTERLLDKANSELSDTKSKIDSVNCNLEFILESIGANSQLLLKDTGKIKEYVEELRQSISQNDSKKAKGVIAKIFGEHGYDNINIILQVVAIACGLIK